MFWLYCLAWSQLLPISTINLPQLKKGPAAVAQMEEIAARKKTKLTCPCLCRVMSLLGMAGLLALVFAER
jgi:hypothetical protein